MSIHTPRENSYFWLYFGGFIWGFLIENRGKYFLIFLPKREGNILKIMSFGEEFFERLFTPKNIGEIFMKSNRNFALSNHVLMKIAETAATTMQKVLKMNRNCKKSRFQSWSREEFFSRWVKFQNLGEIFTPVAHF